MRNAIGLVARTTRPAGGRGEERSPIDYLDLSRLYKFFGGHFLGNPGAGLVGPLSEFWAAFISVDGTLFRSISPCTVSA
jgi:hypothetical protein